MSLLLLRGEWGQTSFQLAPASVVPPSILGLGWRRRRRRRQLLLRASGAQVYSYKWGCVLDLSMSGRERLLHGLTWELVLPPLGLRPDRRRRRLRRRPGYLFVVLL